MADKTLMDKQERKTIQTSFYLLFPIVIVACIAVYYSPFGIGMIGLGLAIFQFLLIKNFVEDYYQRK